MTGIDTLHRVGCNGFHLFRGHPIGYLAALQGVVGIRHGYGPPLYTLLIRGSQGRRWARVTRVVNYPRIHSDICSQHRNKSEATLSSP